MECTRTVLRLWACKATTALLPVVHGSSNHRPRAPSPHLRDLVADLQRQLVRQLWRVAHLLKGLGWAENEDEETSGLRESTPCFSNQQARQTAAELALRFVAVVRTGVQPPMPRPHSRPGHRPLQASPRMATALCPLNRDDQIFCQNEFPALPGPMKDIPVAVTAVAEAI